MEIKSSALMRGNEFIPVVTVDDEARYFETPLPEQKHFFMLEAEAQLHADNTVSELRKTALLILQGMGFITGGQR